MKTLMLVACVLAISYASDPEKVKELYDNYEICAQELNVPKMFTSDVIKCELQKLELIDEQGLIMKEKLLAYYDNVISDETKLHQAKDIASTCIEQAYQGPGSNDEKTMIAITCGAPVTDLFDKPQ